MWLGWVPDCMLRVPVVLVGLLVVAAAAAGAPGVAAQQEVTLTVSVVTPDGDAVGGATLDASWANGTTTESTAANGKAFVDVPAGANVSIEVDHPDYVRNHPVEVTDAGSREVEVTVREKGSLTVSVADANGEVADASVVVRQDGRVVAHGPTDGTGVYDTGVIEVGSYHVTVVKRSYYRTTFEVDVDGDVQESATIEQGSVVLGFNVTDPHFSPPRPVAGATISIDGVGDFNTLDNGEATARVPVNADLPVAVTKDGYETNSTTVEVDESGSSIALNLSRTPLVNLSTTSDRVIAGERIEVDVADEYGDPIEGATVLLDGSAVGETDARGEAAVRLEGAGNHTLRAEVDGMASSPVVVEAVSVGGDTTTAAPTTAAPTTDATNTTATGTTTTGGQAGFGVAVALAALLGAALVAARRR